MSMHPWKNTLTKALSLLLSAALASPAYARGVSCGPMSSPEVCVLSGVKTQALVNANPEYVKTLSEELKAIGAKKVNCTSGYRSPDEQAAACRRICGNPNGCPNTCARPGRSQHQQQRIAVCDLSGLPQNGCHLLKRLCDEKYGAKCGIGGYPGGGYHFGVNDDHFSAWNRCAGLPRPKGNYPPGYRPPDNDPSPGSGAGSELDASELSNNHEIILLAAIAAAGAGGYLLYKQLRKK